MKQFRGVAQLVAHMVWDQGVAGSNPVTPTKKRLSQEILRESLFYTNSKVKCQSGKFGAHLQKLGEFSLSFVIVFTAVSNLNHSHVFSSSLSLMSFGRPKGPKGPAHGKSSRALLCSGVVNNILQSKSPCHLNLSVDFWVMRIFLS